WGAPAALAALAALLFAAPLALRRSGGARTLPRSRADVALAIAGLRKSFGDRAVLDGVDLELRAGRSLVLWGANGAGKSTLIKCLLGLHDYEGRISVFGKDARREGPEARALLGYVAQEFAGYDWSVGDAMAFVARLRGVDADRIAPALERCGLAAETRKRVCDLSGGMKQKLSLAQA